jgi:hypothetical protein
MPVSQELLVPLLSIKNLIAQPIPIPEYQMLFLAFCYSRRFTAGGGHCATRRGDLLCNGLALQVFLNLK